MTWVRPDSANTANQAITEPNSLRTLPLPWL